MNSNINFHNSNDLNTSNSSEKILDEILAEDLLTYSVDKNQSLTNTEQFTDSHNIIIDNHNQSLKNIIPNNDNYDIYDNSLIKQNNRNEYKIKNNNLPEKYIEKGNIDINKENNNDLSSLQISINLSDIDSKDIIYQNIKNKKIFNNNKKCNKIRNNDYLENNNILINISDENVISNISNNNNVTNNYSSVNSNLQNINNQNNQNDEKSSVSSICNYLQSLNSNINNNIINCNKYNIGTNYLISNNISKKNKQQNLLKYNKEQNINIFINPKEKQNKKNKKINIKSNILSEYKINNNENNPQIKHNYQFEKSENIQLSIISNFNNYKGSIIDNYNNQISINKGQYFTIHNSTLNNNFNPIENNEIIKKIDASSLKMIKEQINFNKKKGKLKLINNKNINIQKNESKNFFYNPKLDNIINQFDNIGKEQNNILNNKKNDYIFNLNNKTELSERYVDTFPNYTDKKRMHHNFNKSDKNNHYHNKNINKISNNNISYNNNNSKISKSFNKKNNKKVDNKQCKIHNHNSRCNTYNKKNNQIMKIKNIEYIDVNSNNYFNDIYNGGKNKEVKSSFKSKYKNKIRKNEYITDLSKQKNNYHFREYSHNFMNQIKSSQKETTNKLLNKLNNLNNMNINIINKGAILPIISKAFEKKLDSRSKTKKAKNKQKLCSIKIYKSKREIKEKINCFIENSNKRQKTNKKIDKSNKKINTQINIASLLNNFNKKEKKRENNKSLFNFGNIFFINQNQLFKKDFDILSNKMHENNDINKEKIIILNDDYNNSKLNTLNYSIIRKRPKVINDFSNYKKKNSNKGKKEKEMSIFRNNDEIINPKRMNTDINFTVNNFNMKYKIKDSFKLKKVEGDNCNDITNDIYK